MPTTITGTDGVSQVQAGVIATADINDGAVTAAKINSAVELGITEADQWRLTTDLRSPSGVLNSNLERVDTDGQGTLGVGVTESSGVFTFPSTGIWLVCFATTVDNNLSIDNIGLSIEATINSGISFNTVSKKLASVSGSQSNQAAAIYLSSLINVTNTSEVKVRFILSTFGTSSDIRGSTDSNETELTFIRLGDS